MSLTLSNMQKNNVGTLSFDGLFPGMRKAQEFTVYPLAANDPLRITVQSDTRIGVIDLSSGQVSMSKPHSSGAYFFHLSEAMNVGNLDSETLFMLKAQVAATSSAKAGSNGIVYVDNSGAQEVFG